MRALAALVLLAACGPDPCVIEAKGIPHEMAAEEMGVTETEVTCSEGLNCAGAVSVSPRECDDGFGYVVEAGGVVVLLRFRADTAWWVGVQDELGAVAHFGSVQIAGLPTLGEAPRATQTVAFATFGPGRDGTSIGGSFRATW